MEAILVNNFGSNKFFIVKEIGWSLRDYSKTNPELVKEFVEKCKDKYAKLFIVTLIKLEKFKYSYGRQANKSLPYGDKI